MGTEHQPRKLKGKGRSNTCKPRRKPLTKGKGRKGLRNLWARQAAERTLYAKDPTAEVSRKMPGSVKK